jgi:arabinan endo-1,5-alpha-L-arabinosidase
MDWDLVAGDGVNASNPLFDNVVTELADAFAYATVVGLWAADVLELRSTGEFLMYYNSCQGASPLSAMGIATSANIEGPYEDEGIFMYSGGGGYNASVLPNAIDPDVFYAPDGNLWMVYGSYSGGIYIMEMDEATGFPEGDETYGTHLLGGNHIQIEGAFIQYSPESGYYYLFTSYGGLAAGDGYNMRVARATTPGGPYFDHNGVDQATFTSAPYDASGVKVMGDHVWDGSGNLGYVSPGHNSTYYDASTGEYFLIFHARFPGMGNFHQIRVHQMYVNAMGWLAVAPLRYAPRLPSSGSPGSRLDYVGLDEIPGSYQFINHGRDTAGTIKSSVAANLASDGAVSGALSGTWSFGGNNVFVVTVGGDTFFGVVSRQWNQSADAFQVTFSGVSSGGETLWAIRTGD